MGTVRPAVETDLPSMVALSGKKRREYAGYQPTFGAKLASRA